MEELAESRRAYGKYAYIICLFSSSCRCSACFDTDKGLCIYLIFFYHHFHVNLPWGVVLHRLHEVQLFIICFSVAIVAIFLINCAAAYSVFHNSNKLHRSRPIYIRVYVFVYVSELYKNNNNYKGETTVFELQVSWNFKQLFPYFFSI